MSFGHIKRGFSGLTCPEQFVSSY